MATDKLKGVHPDLVERINRVLQAMAILGHPMKVVQGVRTAQQQLILYHQGRLTKGPIVTNADGVVNKSNHQQWESDKLGHAVDCAFLGAEPFSEAHPWNLYVECVKAVGLKSGADFKNVDRPHAELT